MAAAHACKTSRNAWEQLVSHYLIRVWGEQHVCCPLREPSRTACSVHRPCYSDAGWLHGTRCMGGTWWVGSQLWRLLVPLMCIYLRMFVGVLHFAAGRTAAGE